MEIDGEVTDAEASALHAAAFDHELVLVPWRERLEAHSLFWVTARRGGELVGFVNVIGDGGAHAVLLDTCVDPAHQGQGIGKRLMSAVADEAAGRGCHWLHADYEESLAGFYQSCGLRATAAGLLDLRAAAPS